MPGGRSSMNMNSLFSGMCSVLIWLIMHGLLFDLPFQLIVLYSVVIFGLHH